MKLISNTHSVVIGKPGAQETVPPGEVFDGDQAMVDAGIAVKYSPPKKAAPEPPESINLNEATAEQLTSIKGVGKATAGDIVAAREQAKFESLEDVANRVGGVSLEQLETADVTV